MKKHQDREKKVKQNPIRLDDLLPKKDVTGGGRKTVFGMIKRNKQQEQ